LSRNNTVSREEQGLSTTRSRSEYLNQLALLIRDNRFDEARTLWSTIKQEYLHDYRSSILQVINYVRSLVDLRDVRVFIELFYDYFGPIIRRYVNYASRYIEREPRWINVLEAYAAKLYVEVMLFGDRLASSIVGLYIRELKNPIKKRLRILFDSCTTLECIEEKIDWVLREIKRKENIHLSRHIGLFEQLILELLAEYRDRVLELLERDSRKLRTVYGYSASNIRKHFPYTTRFVEDEVICDRIATMGDRLFKRKCT